MRSKGTKCDWIAQEQNKTEFLFSYSNKLRVDHDRHEQGCITCSILPSGMGAHGVSLEHVENMEMFSCSPT